MNIKARLTQKFTRPQLHAFLEAHSTQQRALEVGAKDRPYRDLFPNTVSGDIAPTPDIDLQFDAHHLPFAADSFEMLICTEVLEHCVHPRRVIQEFHRALKPGGKIILSTRFIFPIHDAPHDYFRFTKYGLESLFADFSHVEIHEELPTVETMAVLMQRLAGQVEWKIPLARMFLYVGAKIVARLGGLVKTEYGDIRKTAREQHILASGYYVLAVK